MRNESSSNNDDSDDDSNTWRENVNILNRCDNNSDDDLDERGNFIYYLISFEN